MLWVVAILISTTAASVVQNSPQPLAIEKFQLEGPNDVIIDTEVLQEDAQKILRCKESSLWPHRDCSQYNICANGKLVAMPCPEGLQWNSIVKRCVWPRLSTCWRKNSDDGIQQFNTQINDVPIQNDISLDDAQIGINYGLVEDEIPQEDPQKILRCKESSQWPHRDCSQYNICANGRLVAMPCPEGLQWNSIIKRCVWPQHSTCRRKSSNVLDKFSCKEGSLWPHRDCSQFNIYANGKLVAMPCPEGLQWNSIVKRCVFPRLSTCWRKNSQQEITQLDVQVDGSNGVLTDDVVPQDEVRKILLCKESSLWPHKDCSHYNICANGKLVAMPCPEGLQWNSIVKRCVLPQHSTCRRKSSNVLDKFSCKESSLWPHKDCSQYNICANGKLVAMPCPEGLQWNSIVKRCVWPRLSTCWRKNSDDGIQQFDTQINDVPMQNDITLDDALSGINYGLTEVEIRQEDPQKILRCKESSLWPHRDCSQYNICANGKLVAMPCPEGLHWDARNKICDTPRNAKCIRLWW